MSNQLEAQKSLNLVSDTISLLNKRRLGLNSVEEGIKNIREQSSEIQRNAVQKEKEVRQAEERLSILRSLKEQVGRELGFLLGRVSQKELAMLNTKNVTSIEHNKIKFLRDIRKKTNSELKELELDVSSKAKTKSRTNKEIVLAINELSQIKEEGEKIKVGLERRETNLKKEKDNFQKELLGHKKYEKYLNRLASRLRAFAKERHLNFKI